MYAIPSILYVLVACITSCHGGVQAYFADDLSHYEHWCFHVGWNFHVAYVTAVYSCSMYDTMWHVYHSKLVIFLWPELCMFQVYRLEHVILMQHVRAKAIQIMWFLCGAYGQELCKILNPSPCWVTFRACLLFWKLWCSFSVYAISITWQFCTMFGGEFGMCCACYSKHVVSNSRHFHLSCTLLLECGVHVTRMRRNCMSCMHVIHRQKFSLVLFHCGLYMIYGRGRCSLCMGRYDVCH